MHTEGPKPNNLASLLRLAAVGLLATAATFTLRAQAAPAAAPTDDKKDDVVVLSEFTVTGSYVASLAQGAKEKEDAPGIMEVIAPVDIGVLPDVSIADDLARLPGLTSQRVNGRFQDITIRGLSGDFNVGTLDGVEQATTGGNLGGDSRAVEYDQYPSSLIGGVQVFKTGEADMVGGLGGTVDLQTVSPLSTPKTIALSAYYNWTAYPQLTPGVNKAGESYSLSYVDQFVHGTEGIYVGFSHDENPYEGKQFQSWGPPYPTDSSGNLILGGMRIYDQSELLKRTSGVMVIESQPNDQIHSKLDLFLSYYNDDQPLRGMEIPMAEWSSAQLQPGYTVTNGLITNYTLTNVQPVDRSMDTLWVAHMQSAVWNLDLGQKTDWPVHLTAGYSRAEKNQEVLETYSGLGFRGGATDPATFQVVEDAGSLPTVVSSNTFSDASQLYLTDPQGWGPGNWATGMEGYLKYFDVIDVADSVKAEVTHQLDATIFKDVVIGMSYSERFKQQGQNPTGYLVNSNGLAEDPLPTETGTTDLSWIGNLHPVAYDAEAAYSSGLLKFVPNPNPGSWEGDNYKVWEEITRPFVKFDLKGNLGAIPFEGNIGVVVDAANQSSSGYAGNTSNQALISPVSGAAAYNDALPTLNLTFKLTNSDLLRFFAGREEQRPDMYYMRASRDYTYNAANATSTSLSPWGATSGNPELRPWLANAVDLDFEHYFPKSEGYISAAVFDKNLLNYVYQQNTVEDFTGYVYTGPAPLIYTGVASQYVNGTGGNIHGVEATLELTTNGLFHGAIPGFGVNLNGLVVDSSIQPFGPGNGNEPLPDLSKKTANVTLFYEGHGFSARISEHYQSQTREYIVSFGVPSYSSLGTANDGYSEETPFHTIDAQVSYEFRKGYLKGLTIYVEGRNLNNAPQVTYYNGDPRQLTNWQEFGASYRTGLTYKF